ncbi:MAG: type II toxin-antitoxin system Phd/YefM family antitoxin [Spirochaetales bacterium]|nr:type II toxin-antitoxin system Phd/YefM family antitoxin [Spirochaetales bacterium]
MRTWQLQEAKSKFSQVINLACSESPQKVSKNGKTVAYIISAEEYEKQKGLHLKKILLNRPHKDIELELSRQQDQPRDLEF